MQRDYTLHPTPETLHPFSSLISKLDDALRNPILGAEINGHAQHDRVAGFQRINHPLEVSQALYRDAIDLRDDFAFFDACEIR